MAEMQTHKKWIIEFFAFFKHSQITPHYLTYTFTPFKDSLKPQNTLNSSM